MDGTSHFNDLCAMEVIVLQTEAYNHLLATIEARINAAIKKALDDKENAEKSDWITLQEASKLLP
ncbi:MAG: hypothetical protein JNJ99_03195, partial [Crocinitomicaceae bacterium]|nr:hypothetical protein [Crocinitomicaceae bacterium]